MGLEPPTRLQLSKGELPDQWVQDLPTRQRVARELIEDFEAQLKTTAETHWSARLHYEIARLHEAPLGDLAKAMHHFTAAFRLNAEHLPTVRGARRALLGSRRYANAIAYFDAESRLLSDSPEKARVLLAKGIVLQTHLDQARQAREAFEQARNLAPDDLTIQRYVEQAQRRDRAWVELGGTLENIARSVARDPQHQAAVMAQRAALAALHDRAHDRAVEFYQEALKLDPSFLAVTAPLKALLYRAERWGDLTRLLQFEADTAQGTPAKVQALYQRGRWQRVCLGDLDAARESYEAALNLDPEHAVCLHELAQTYRALQEYRPLTRVLQRLAKRASGADGARLWYQIGEIFEQQLQDLDSALRAHAESLACDPLHPPALNAAERLLVAQEQWEQIVGLRTREAQCDSDPLRRAQARVAVAKLYEERLDQPLLAMDQYRQALALVPDHALAFKALVRLLQQQRRHLDLVELYGRAVEAAQVEGDKISYLFKIARLQEDELDQPLEAARTYQRVLQIDSQHLEALHSWQRAAERGKAYEELITALEAEAKLARQGSQRLLLLHRAAEICDEGLGDPDRAIKRLQAVLQLDPLHGPSLVSLGRLLQAQGRHEELLQNYRAQLPLQRSSTEKAALLLCIGQVAARQLGNWTEALSAYREAIRHEPSCGEAYEALEQIHAQQGEWKEVARCLELWQGQVTEPAHKARLGLRLAEVQELRLKDLPEALKSFEKATELDPALSAAFEGRCRVLERLGEYQKLAQALSPKHDEVQSPHEAANLQYLAGLQADHLGKPGLAAEQLARVLAYDDRSRSALVGLEALYCDLGDWQRLAEVHRRLAAVSQSLPAKISGLMQLERLAEERELSAPAELIETLRRTLELEPHHLGVLLELERLALNHSDWGLLLEVDRKLGALSTHADLGAAHRTRLAEAIEVRHPESALEIYRAALAQEPANLAAVRGIARLAEQARDLALLTEAAKLEAGACRSRSRAARLMVIAAEARLERGDKPAAAADALTALGYEPDQRQAAELVNDLLLETGKAAECADALMRAAAAAALPESRARLWVAASRVQAEKLEDMGAAIASANRALSHRTKDLAALTALADYYEQTKQWQQAAVQLRAIAAQNQDRAEASKAQLRLSRLLAYQLKEPAAALTGLRNLAQSDPDALEVQFELARLEVSLGNTAAALTVVEHLAGLKLPAHQLAEVHTLRAELAVQRRDKPAAGEAFACALRLLGPESKVAKRYTQWLEGLPKAEQREHWRGYAEAATDYVTGGDAQQEQASRIYEALASIYRDILGDLDKAVFCLRRVLSIQPEKTALRLDLAYCLDGLQRFEESSTEYLELIRHGVTEGSLWSDFTAAAQHRKAATQARLSLSVAVRLAPSNDLQRAQVAEFRFARSEAPIELRKLAGCFVRQAGDSSKAAVAARLTPVIGKLFPQGLSRYGVSARERMTQENRHPLRQLLNEYAARLGVEECHLYLHPQRVPDVDVLLDEVPCILLSERVAALDASSQLFLLLRALYVVARGTVGVIALSVEELEQLYRGVAYATEPGFELPVAEVPDVMNWSKRIMKAVPWRSKRRIEEAIREYLSRPPHELVGFCAREQLNAARFASLFAPDLGSVLALLRQPGAGFGSGRQVAPGEVLAFAVSDQAVEARKLLGLID